MCVLFWITPAALRRYVLARVGRLPGRLGVEGEGNRPAGSAVFGRARILCYGSHAGAGQMSKGRSILIGAQDHHGSAPGCWLARARAGRRRGRPTGRRCACTAHPGSLVYAHWRRGASAQAGVNVRILESRVGCRNNGTQAPEHEQAEVSFRSRLCPASQRSRPTRAALHAPTSAAIIPEGQGERKRNRNRFLAARPR